jgi:AcrR family transcriptional regulator
MAGSNRSARNHALPTRLSEHNDALPERLNGQRGGLDRERLGDGLGRERVAEIQRARILSATVNVVAERGVGNATVAHIVTRAGVSRRTFYELFKDCEDCLLAAFDEAVGRVTTVLAQTHTQQSRWSERVRAGLLALLSFLESEPSTACLLIVESLAAGPRTLERRSRAIKRLIAIVDEGRLTRPNNAAQPLAAEGIVGAGFSLIHSRLLEEDPAELLGLVNPLMSMIVLPYQGPAAARRELDHTIQRPRKQTQRTHQDPLRDLKMRLTYRTVRVLLAVAANPGASNRVVADGSGIADQGQISKLLTRLHGLGLVQNTGNGPTQGAPNAWTLTDKGWEVQAAIGP